MDKGYQAGQIVVWMSRCAPERLPANRVMLCARNLCLLENGYDMTPDEFREMLAAAGSAGIVKE